MPLLLRLAAHLAAGALVIATLAAQRGDAPTARLAPPAEEATRFQLPPGFAIQLVAAEPDLEKPFNLAFDAAGRVWVTGSILYPWPARRDALGEPIRDFTKQWDDNQLAFRASSTPPEPPEHGRDTLRVLSDFGPDGRARKSVVFADGLNIPTGVLPLPRAPGAKGDSVLVFSIPAIWKLTDTDGDGRADRREKLYDGFGFKDTHGMSSNYWLWLDGWVYGTHGFANRSEIVDRQGRTVTLTSGNTYRFRPDGSRFEAFVHGQTNPFGLAFDARGDLYTADSHSKPVYLLLPGGSYEGIGKEHDGLGFAPAITSDDHGSSAIAGIAHYSAAHFPAEFRDNLFNGNPVTRRINRVRLDWRGSTPAAARQPDFLTSDDPAFRPVQVKLGPDGALWVADFYNPIIGHYEVPLTHPARDHAHGRIWRIVWQGLDGQVTPPTLPDLSSRSSAQLVAALADPNLVVRSLALSELLGRPDAAAQAPALAAAARAHLTGADPRADDTAALPLLFALERLGRGDDALLDLALRRPDSPAALSALRVLAARDTLPAGAAEWIQALASPTDSAKSDPAPAQRAAPGLSWRFTADLLTRHPQPWAAPLLLAMLAKAPESDSELTYALRLALKAQALTADVATLRGWARPNAATADRLADVCLAVPTPSAAEFLLGHLAAAKFSGPRTGEFARHAILQLPPKRLSELEPLLEALRNAPPAQRLAVAEGLATAAAKPKTRLPATVSRWMRQELIATVQQADAGRSLRAINALKPLTFAAKVAPLRRVALDTSARESNRSAALRALPTTATGTIETATQVLTSNAPVGLRRAAAEVIGQAFAGANDLGAAGAAARQALASAYRGAPADLALALTLALAKDDAGATVLVKLAQDGRVRTALLRHRHVVLALESRPAALRAEIDVLTRGLPPEDARLDALVAQRLGQAGSHKPNAARGAPLFATHCAACHRFRDSGGNIGPSLDGISSRPMARLVEDILDPSRNIDPAFRLTTVTLRDGRTVSGLDFQDGGAESTVRDPASGEVLRFAKGEITTSVPSPVSPMPATFETTLSEAEFFDLLEYLRKPAP